MAIPRDGSGLHECSGVVAGGGGIVFTLPIDYLRHVADLGV